jgi:hypothetical protein
MGDVIVFERRPIIENCIGCGRIIKNIIDGVEKECCKMYLYPDVKWKLGACNAATHIERKVTEIQKKRIGQQKQKKHT